jgi:hypothetical protein
MTPPSESPLLCTECAQPLPADRKYTCAACVPKLRSASGQLVSEPWAPAPKPEDEHH